jgi:DnaJ-class molecular chaperone
LIIEKKITLLESLTGIKIFINTLDNRTLLIESDEILQPGVMKSVEFEGMPLFKNNTFGDLIVCFQIIFPQHLNQELKIYLKLILDDDKNSDKNKLILNDLKKNSEKFSYFIENNNDKNDININFKKVSFKPGYFFEGKQVFQNPYKNEINSNSFCKVQ